MTSSNVMLYILIYKNPFNSADDRSQHILNETFIFVASCSLICFTDIYTDLDSRLIMRHLYLGLLGIAVMSNLIFILNTMCRKALLYKKKWLNARDY